MSLRASIYVRGLHFLLLLVLANTLHAQTLQDKPAGPVARAGKGAAQITAIRMGDAPLVTVNSSPTLAGNVNGPALIRVPEWIQHPLGRYYLYFANHKGKFIRLAYANSVTGPWKIYEPGVLKVEDTAFNRPASSVDTGSLYTHVASPDIYIDAVSHKIILWAHGMWTDGQPWPSDLSSGQAQHWLADHHYEQYTQAFESSDGVHFTSHPAITKTSYLRVFRYGDSFYSVSRLGRVGRSGDPFSEFALGQSLFQEAPWAGRVRHVALLRRGDTLHVFFTVIGDAPEHVQEATVDLTRPWQEWKADHPVDVLTSETNYECSQLPVSPSRAGDIDEPVHQLRDPAIFEDAGHVFLLYSTCGEQGIALAELHVP
jgi:hypothetical protein